MSALTVAVWLCGIATGALSLIVGVLIVATVRMNRHLKRQQAALEALQGRAFGAEAEAELSLGAMIEELGAAWEQISQEMAAEAARHAAALQVAAGRGIGRALPPAESPDAGDVLRQEHVQPAEDRPAAVRSLADSGMSVAEIARALSMGKGEVELILRMPRRGGQQENAAPLPESAAESAAAGSSVADPILNESQAM